MQNCGADPDEELAHAGRRHLDLTGLPVGCGATDRAAALPVGLATEHDALSTPAGFTTGRSVLVVGATSSGCWGSSPPGRLVRAS